MLLTLQDAIWPLLIIGFFHVARYVYNVIHLAYIGPLCKIPGPKLYFLSRKLASSKQAKGMRWKWIQYELFPKYGPFVRIAPRAVLIADKDAIKQILVTNELPKNDKYLQLELNSTTLLTARTWHKQRRRMLSPAFSIKYLTSIEPLIHSVFEDLIEKMEQSIASVGNLDCAVINFVKIIQACTMDIIGETAFGSSFKTIMNGDHLLTQKVFEERRRRNLVGMFPILKYFMKLDPYVENFANNLMEGRRNGSRRQDLLQTILDAQHEDGGMTDIEICDQIIEFIFAGSDTTSFTTTMVFAMLVENPEVMKKLTEELDEALKDDESGKFPSHGKLKDLTYLNCVVNETLRLHPISHDAGPGKVTTEDTVLGGYLIPKGTMLGANIFQLHHSAKYWGEDVNEFKPERWLNPDKIPKDCFIPFSAGTRNCIGNNFALMVIRLLVSTLLARYRLEEIPGQDKDVVQFFTPNFKTKRYDIKVWKR
ncbi:5674_t:CDS:10 [Acaulospora morrowiae]|uniref:5674_t:CDS:1 n=1 Tax=Acaulospora morrowiae TaxID=94023 RepID=A0A9N8VWE1_9GLOM|nr:5674_t:CDS:10 [Acaulospora morrowiae]